jgi:hypothetical protein
VNTEIFNELQKLKKIDLEARQKLLEESHLYDGYADEMQKIHTENAIRLNEIINEYGWPGESLVTLEGSRAAWLIAQHSICTPELQIKFSQEIEKAFNSGEVPKKQMVLLQDQVLFRQNKPQKCGWVYDWQPDGQLGCVVESIEQADILREELGMPKYNVALEKERTTVKKEGGNMPGSYEDYRSKANAWRESVGWNCTA